MVWVGCDADHLVINTEVELRTARANIDALAQKYLDADDPEELIHSERVMLKIACSIVAP